MAEEERQMRKQNTNIKDKNLIPDSEKQAVYSSGPQLDDQWENSCAFC